MWRCLKYSRSWYSFYLCKVAGWVDISTSSNKLVQITFQANWHRHFVSLATTKTTRPRSVDCYNESRPTCSCKLSLLTFYLCEVSCAVRVIEWEEDLRLWINYLGSIHGNSLLVSPKAHPSPLLCSPFPPFFSTSLHSHPTLSHLIFSLPIPLRQFRGGKGSSTVKSPSLCPSLSLVSLLPFAPCPFPSHLRGGVQGSSPENF